MIDFNKNFYFQNLFPTLFEKLEDISNNVPGIKTQSFPDRYL